MDKKLCLQFKEILIAIKLLKPLESSYPHLQNNSLKSCCNDILLRFLI